MFNIIHPRATEIPEIEELNEEEALALLGNYVIEEVV